MQLPLGKHRDFGVESFEQCNVFTKLWHVILGDFGEGNQVRKPEWHPVERIPPPRPVIPQTGGGISARGRWPRGQMSGGQMTGGLLTGDFWPGFNYLGESRGEVNTHTYHVHHSYWWSRLGRRLLVVQGRPPTKD